MAQETFAHRADVELTAGAPTAVPADLALDGIDEALQVLLVHGIGTQLVGDGHVVAVTAGEQTWRSGSANEASTPSAGAAPPTLRSAERRRTCCSTSGGGCRPAPCGCPVTLLRDVAAHVL